MEEGNKALLGLIFVFIMGVGVIYFYPYYIGYDNCVGGSWENVTEEVYFNETFPRIARYYCSPEAEITEEECLNLDNLLNVDGCKWGGKTSKRNSKGNQYRLYVMEDPELPVESITISSLSSKEVIDVGLDKTQGITIDLTENGMFHKILEIKLDKDISAQDLGLLLKNANFDTSKINGILKKQVSQSKQKDIYENVCNPYYGEELPNGSSPYYSNCSEVFKETITVNYSVMQEIELKSSESDNNEHLEAYSILEKGLYTYTFNVPLVETKSGWGNIGEIQVALDGKLFTDRQGTSWWNLSWQRRKAINITENNATKLVRYAINLTVIYDTDMNDTFHDLRFVNNSQNAELDYWIENYSTGVNASVWVEVPHIPASGQTNIYMFYNNPSASTTSNGTNTFPFYEGWDTPRCVDPVVWWNDTLVGDNCSGGFLTYIGFNGGELNSRFNSSAYTAVRFRARKDDSDADSATGLRSLRVSTANFMYLFHDTSNVVTFHIGASGGGPIIGTYGTAWDTYDIMMLSTKHTRVFRNGNLSAVDKTEVALPKANWISCNTGSTYYEEWRLVRNYTQLEPSIVFGAEEEPADSVYPLLDLNAPANFSNHSSSTIDFNWTCTDETNGTDMTTNFNLDGKLNLSTTSANGTLKNIQVTGIPAGDHYWSVNCSDATNVNVSANWNFSVIVLDVLIVQFLEAIFWDSGEVDYALNVTVQNLDALNTSPLTLRVDPRFNSTITSVGTVPAYSFKTFRFTNTTALRDSSEDKTFNITQANVTDGFNYAYSNPVGMFIPGQIGDFGIRGFCTQYVQVQSYNNTHIDYNLTVECFNPRTATNYTNVTVTPDITFGSAKSMVIAANSSNSSYFTNQSTRGTSDSPLFSISGATITKNITMTTNPIVIFVPIDPPSATTKFSENVTLNTNISEVIFEANISLLNFTTFNITEINITALNQTTNHSLFLIHNNGSVVGKVQAKLNDSAPDNYTFKCGLSPWALVDLNSSYQNLNNSNIPVDATWNIWCFLDLVNVGIAYMRDLIFQIG